MSLVVATVGRDEFGVTVFDVEEETTVLSGCVSRYFGSDPMLVVDSWVVDKANGEKDERGGAGASNGGWVCGARADWMVEGTVPA